MSGICSLYRDPKFIVTGKSLGFCDQDEFESVCEGDFRFCEKSEEMRKHLLTSRERGRSLKSHAEENQEREI